MMMMILLDGIFDLCLNTFCYIFIDTHIASMDSFERLRRTTLSNIDLFSLQLLTDKSPNQLKIYYIFSVCHRSVWPQIKHHFAARSVGEQSRAQ